MGTKTDKQWAHNGTASTYHKAHSDNENEINSNYSVVNPAVQPIFHCSVFLV